ncbi:MAG: S-methyl-5'-thioadenosine phosphorylase, partial [Elusimicrobia bacterium]|nr:S-methyl-5'-thioadenosine phosphorylase [Elusimicrobiota bacterium]
FGKGVVAHVAFAHPFCADMAGLLHGEARGLGITAHRGGTYVCMEGPLFSTKAESLMHRQLGYSIIGMTAVPEAKLAREAEICYQPVALVTDYDCWKEEDHVSTEKVVEHLMANVENAQRLLAAALPRLAALPRSCPCARALKGALFTDRKAMAPAAVKALKPLIGKYLA